MENLKLGQIITTSQQRDAIHIAVAPVVAGSDLRPGQGVAMLRGKAFPGMPAIGVVDPFLVHSVDEGQTFWLYLNPGSITSLRHEWTHPEFVDPEPVSHDKSASEQWLRAFCTFADCPDYETVMQGVQGYFSAPEGYDGYYREGGYVEEDYLHFNGSDAHGEIPPEFWTHAEIVLGKKLPHHAKSFSCSC